MYCTGIPSYAQMSAHSPTDISSQGGSNVPRSSRGKWTSHEDETLRDAVAAHQGKSWKKIAEYFPDRDYLQCLHRWKKVLNPDLVKGPWSQEEDRQLIELVNINGTKKWSQIAQSITGRNGKQCRERWTNHLNPDIRKDDWTYEEEQLLTQAHRDLGNRWALLAKRLPNRSENDIKNHWNSLVKRRQAAGHDVDSTLVPPKPVRSRRNCSGGMPKRRMEESAHAAAAMVINGVTYSSSSTSHESTSQSGPEQRERSSASGLSALEPPSKRSSAPQWAGATDSHHPSHHEDPSSTDTSRDEDAAAHLMGMATSVMTPRSHSASPMCNSGLAAAQLGGEHEVVDHHRDGAAGVAEVEGGDATPRQRVMGGPTGGLSLGTGLGGDDVFSAPHSTPRRPSGVMGAYTPYTADRQSGRIGHSFSPPAALAAPDSACRPDMRTRSATECEPRPQLSASPAAWEAASPLCGALSPLVQKSFRAAGVLAPIGGTSVPAALRASPIACGSILMKGSPNPLVNTLACVADPLMDAHGGVSMSDHSNLSVARPSVLLTASRSKTGGCRCAASGVEDAACDCVPRRRYSRLQDADDFPPPLDLERGVVVGDEPPIV